MQNDFNVKLSRIIAKKMSNDKVIIAMLTRKDWLNILRILGKAQKMSDIPDYIKEIFDL